MSTPVSASAMGNNSAASILPQTTASGPGYLGPSYSPADELLPPASVGVHRGNNLGDVVGAVKGVIYYGDMIGFGQSSSSFTSGMPLKPLGVNYFVNSGLTCSNGATMWEFVETIPNGSGLGNKVKDALAGVGLPALRGMAPGMLEDTEGALNPMPIINAVVGSGYPQCKLVRKQVGDIDGKIQNVDGVLMVDPVGILSQGGRYYQEKWIQDRDNKGNPIMLTGEDWTATPKIYGDNGCLLVPTGAGVQSKFCGIKSKPTLITLGDGTTVNAWPIDGFADYCSTKKRSISGNASLISLSVAVVSFMCLLSFWATKRK